MRIVYIHKWHVLVCKTCCWNIGNLSGFGKWACPLPFCWADDESSQKLKRGYPKKCCVCDVLYEIIIFGLILLLYEMRWLVMCIFSMCVAVTGGNTRLFGEEPASFSTVHMFWWLTGRQKTPNTNLAQHWSNKKLQSILFFFLPKNQTKKLHTSLFVLSSLSTLEQYQ